MLEYSSVCYKNSFLTQVIVRVDFAQFIQTNMVFDENIEKFRDILGLEKLLNVPERQLSLGQRMRCNITAAFCIILKLCI